MQNKEYTISEVCDMLKITDSKLRYIEKKLSLDIGRDKLNNRLYDDNSVRIVEEIIKYRKQGLDYKSIKELIETNGEVALSLEETLPNDTKEFILYGDDFDKAIDKIEKSICSTINISIENKFKGIEANLYQDLNIIKEQNSLIKDKLQKQIELEELEKHFKELDNKMTSMLSNKKQRKTSFFSRLFKK